MKNLSCYKKVYFVGIGGVSMSSLAMMLKDRGIAVLGYDRSRSNETRILEADGISISYSLDAPELDGVDLLVYTAAVTPSHPIVALAASKGIETVVRAVLLGAIIDEYGLSVGISGTHGKSTTSGMISKIFCSAAGRDPSFAVGAMLPFQGAYYRIGKDDTFIFEACEYKDSFLSFHATTALVLNIYRDHPDYFKTREQLITSFGKFISGADIAIVNLDCPASVECTRGYNGKLYYYSVEQKTDFYADNIKMNKAYASFSLHYPDGAVEINLSIPGIHNVGNTVAAFAACYLNGLTAEETVAGIESFKGIARRFEKVASVNGADVISDYAHHPDEINACLNTAKLASDGRIIAVMQPYTYSRLKEYFDAFASSLRIADINVVIPVCAARETDDLGVSGAQLAEASEGIYCDGFESAAAFIRETVKPGDMVVLMGCGDIYKVQSFL